VATVEREALPLPAALIRPMELDDAPAVAQLEQASYPFPWSERIICDSVRVGYLCNVMEIDVVLAGYSILAAGAGEAHLLNLCVRESFRHRGLGTRLLQRIFAQAAAAEARLIFLEVRPSNHAAIRLYQAHGFAQLGFRRGYYQAHGGREDALVMRRVLE
jgi:[ribosomal protein S18]-alanine N-acetyltransferase